MEIEDDDHTDKIRVRNPAAEQKPKRFAHSKAGDDLVEEYPHRRNRLAHFREDPTAAVFRRWRR